MRSEGIYGCPLGTTGVPRRASGSFGALFELRFALYDLHLSVKRHQTRTKYGNRLRLVRHVSPVRPVSSGIVLYDTYKVRKRVETCAARFARTTCFFEYSAL